MSRKPGYVGKRVYLDLAKRLNELQDEFGCGPLEGNFYSGCDDIGLELWFKEDESGSPWRVGIVDGQWKLLKDGQ